MHTHANGKQKFLPLPPEEIGFHSVSQAGCEQSSHSLLRIIYGLLSLETWPGFRPSLCTGNLSLGIMAHPL